MPRPGRKLLVDLLKPLLKARGYLKERQTWRKSVGDMIQVFNLQSGAYGDYYFINAGIYFLEIRKVEKPSEAQCGVRRRSDSLLRDESGRPNVLRMDNSMLWEKRSMHIRRLANEALDWLEFISSKSAIAQIVADKKRDKYSHPGVVVCRDAYAYIGDPLPEYHPPKNRKIILRMEGSPDQIFDVGDKKAIKAYAKKIMATRPRPDVPA